ncbi:MAG: energy transducer TonB [Campylobacteraceae bacterium]|jgi:protein TonB|nr:energy transducer TonB [Campylobacteraceae bacterium]
MKRQNSVVGLLTGFILSCAIHGSFFYAVYKYFINNEKEVMALREEFKAPLKMALTAFVIEQPKEPQEEQKPEKEKPKLPEPKQHKIIKEEPVPVPIPIEEPLVEEQEEEISEQVENIPVAQPIQAQNSGDEAAASSTSEDDHIMAIIRAVIDKEVKKNYPSKAKKMHMQGIVTIKIKIDTNGKIALLEITESAGYTMLDLSAIKSIEKASKNFPKPTRDLLFILPISYELI